MADRGRMCDSSLSRTLLSCLLSLAVLLISPLNQAAAAEGDPSIQTEIRVSSKGSELSPDSLSPPLRFETQYIEGIGATLGFSFDQISGQPQHSTIEVGETAFNTDAGSNVVLKGHYSNSSEPAGSLHPVNAAIYGERQARILKAFFVARPKGEAIDQLYEMTVDINDALLSNSRHPAEIRQVGSADLSVNGCGVSSPPERLRASANEISSLSSDQLQGTGIRTIELATEADSAMFALHGANTNTEILNIVNAGGVILMENFGIDFKIVRQHIFTSVEEDPYTEGEPGAFLRQFNDYNIDNPNHLGYADIYHLFTAKTPDTQVVGQAFIGTICETRPLNFGFTRVVASTPNGIVVPHLVFAHEVAHNLGANHDAIGSNLMNPLGSFDSNVSDLTIMEIEEQLAAFSGCLGVDGPPFKNLKISTKKLTSTLHSIIARVRETQSFPPGGARIIFLSRKTANDQFEQFDLIPAINEEGVVNGVSKGSVLFIGTSGQFRFQVEGTELLSDVLTIGNIGGKKRRKKITVCHRRSGRASRTIKIRRAKRRRHLAHGDTRGRCR